ncbi:MAG: hypothetical protein ACI3W5_03375 [Faecousia sp.]
MKKLISVILLFACLLSMAACSNGSKKTPETTPAPTEPELTIDDIDLQTMLYLLDDMSGIQVGSYCYQEEITAENVSFVLGSEGFDLPFESARAYLPTFSTTAFVLAVFRLEEGADAQAFVDGLKANAKPDRWICVHAEAVEAEYIGNTVMFVMSNEAGAQNLKQAFAKMNEPGFRVEDNLIDRLEGLTMDKLYGKLYETYSVAMYGFMDGEDFGAVNNNTGYGLSDLNPRDYIDSLVDTGYAPAEEYDGERSYLLAMFRLAPGVDSAAFAQELVSCVDSSELKGEGQQYVVAWSDDVVIYYVGSGSYAWNSMALEHELSGVYRMETDGVEGW